MPHNPAIPLLVCTITQLSSANFLGSLTWRIWTPMSNNEWELVLNANVQNLELGALVLVASLLAVVSALNLALWGHRLSAALNKSNAITIGLLVALVSCWHLIILRSCTTSTMVLGKLLLPFVMLFVRLLFSWLYLVLSYPCRIKYNRYCL
jgi:hypothetical protein